MYCNNCKNKHLCKFYDSFNVPGIEVKIKSCIHKAVDSLYDFDMMKKMIDPFPKSDESKLPAPEERKSRAFQDISELSNKVRKEKQVEKIKNKLDNLNVSTNIDEECLGTCSICGAENTYTIDCPICLKKICNDCAMVSVNSVTGVPALICEECWDKEEQENIAKVEVQENDSRDSE